MALTSLSGTIKTGATDTAILNPFIGSATLGEDFQMAMTIQDESGNAIDVTGDTVTVTLVPAYKDSSYTVPIGGISIATSVVTVTVADDGPGWTESPNRIQAYMNVLGVGGTGSLPAGEVIRAAWQFDMLRGSGTA